MRDRLPSLRARRAARGVTLVELMVALVISFILIAAAGYLYLSTRESQRAIDSTSGANEIGQFAMQTFSRELMSAGFFPTQWKPAGFLGGAMGYEYVANIQNAGGPAYRFGIFGCKNKRFDPANGTCENHTATSKGDTLVVSYFTMDQQDRGQRADCQGNDAMKDTARNAVARVWGDEGEGGPNDTPKAPLLVINAYRLNATDTQVEGRRSKDWSLSCYGNGAGSTGGFQPLLSGVEDIRFTYGLRAVGDLLSPEKYLDADAVDGHWDRVVSVRVCMLVKATDSAGTKLRNETTGGRSYVGCDGQVVQQAAADSAVYKTFIQTFGVRNHQTKTY